MIAGGRFLPNKKRIKSKLVSRSMIDELQMELAKAHAKIRALELRLKPKESKDHQEPE